MRKTIIIACVAILFSNIAVAQKINRYEGVMVLPTDLSRMQQFLLDNTNNRGEGFYDYYENTDGDRVKHGKFMFIQKYSVSVWKVLSGQYVHGKKTGLWVVKDSILAKERIKKIERHNLQATYADDILNGSFYYKQTSSYGTQILVCSFKNGLIVGDFYTTYGSDTLKGVINSVGLPTGIWTASTTNGIPILQKRYFRNGRLILIEERDESTGERYLCYSIFDGLKNKADINLIKDTIIEGKEGVLYNGHIALLEEDNSHGTFDSRYNSRMGLIGHDCLSESIPTEIRFFTSSIEKQINSWNYTYSEKASQEWMMQIEKQREKRELQKQDSIRRVLREQEERLRREKDEEIRREQERVRDSIRKVEIEQREQEEIELIWQSYDWYKQKRQEGIKNVRKASIDGERIVFQTDDNIISEVFKENNLRLKSGKFIPQEKRDMMIQKYHIRVAASEDGNTLLYYDAESGIPELLICNWYGKERSYVYIISKRIGTKIKQQ